MKLDRSEAIAKILEYLVRLNEKAAGVMDENAKGGSTLYHITRDAFVDTTTQKEARIKEFLNILISKELVTRTTMGDRKEYYDVTEYGIKFYKDNLKNVIERIYSDKETWNRNKEL